MLQRGARGTAVEIAPGLADAVAVEGVVAREQDDDLQRRRAHDDPPLRRVPPPQRLQGEAGEEDREDRERRGRGVVRRAERRPAERNEPHHERGENARPQRVRVAMAQRVDEADRRQHEERAADRERPRLVAAVERRCDRVEDEAPDVHADGLLVVPAGRRLRGLEADVVEMARGRDAGDGDREREPAPHAPDAPELDREERQEGHGVVRQPTRVSVEHHQRRAQPGADRVERAANPVVRVEELEQQQQEQRRQRGVDEVHRPEVREVHDRVRPERVREDAEGRDPAPDLEVARDAPDGQDPDPELQLVDRADRGAEGQELHEEQEGVEDQRLAARLRRPEGDEGVPERVVAGEDLPAGEDRRQDLLRQVLVVRRQDDPRRDQYEDAETEQRQRPYPPAAQDRPRRHS